MSLSDLDYDAYEVGKDAHYGACYEYEHQYAGNAFFQVGVLTKKVACVK